MTATNTLTLKIDQAQAVDHLTALGYQRGDFVYVRYIHPVTKKSIKASKLEFAEANRYQSQGYDAYFVVNRGGDTDNAVTECRVIFYEHDNLDKSVQLGLWQTLGLPEPTIQVDTGGKSIHSYWVFTDPISPEQWRVLQTDLLKYSDGDRSLKNPSRILRLAGSWYMKGENPGTTAATIVSNSGNQYSYERLRAVIPQAQQPKIPTMPQQQTPLIQCKDITVPVLESVPLLECLSKESRQLLKSGGVGNRGRNETGAMLARDLIGTENYLRKKAQQFDGDGRQLFEDWCVSCGLDKDKPLGQPETIWQYALKKNPTASCKEEGVENCIKGWYWRTYIKPTQPAGDRTPTKKLPLEEAAEQVKIVLQANHPELKENIELEKVREACGMSSYDWERKIIKPIKRDLDAERFRLDLLGLLAIDDEVERIRQQAQLAPKYQMSAGTIDRALHLMKERTTTPETQWHSLDDFLDLESEGLRWVIEELIPQGEVVILAGSPKSGKTLLAIDAAFAVATGESAFLKKTVTQGRVLIVSVDESAHSTKAKLIKRGFRKADSSNVQVMTRFDVRQLKALEERLEAFRPTLVIIDSLKRIMHGQLISENSAEFADIIYTIKELLTRYNAAGILIHHTSKNQDALGVGKLRGSSAIAGAVWGSWLLEHVPKKDSLAKKLVIDPKDPRRILSAFCRDAEGQQLRLELDLENNSWINNGCVGDSEEWEEERQTLRARIVGVLKRNTHKAGLTGREIIELLEMLPEQKGSVYSELSRMVGKRLITCSPAPGDKRYHVYSLPDSYPDDHNDGGNDGGNNGGNDGSNNGSNSPDLDPNISPPPPSPPPSDSVASYMSENHIQKEFPIHSKIYSRYIADSQQLVENTPPASYSNPDPEGVTEIHSNLGLNIGGGGVEMSLLPQESNSVTAIATHTPTPQQPIQKGDLVIVDSPGLKRHGEQATVIRLRIERFQGQELLVADVSFPGERRPVEVQLSWLRRVGGQQANE